MGSLSTEWIFDGIISIESLFDGAGTRPLWGVITSRTPACGTRRAGFSQAQEPMPTKTLREFERIDDEATCLCDSDRTDLGCFEHFERDA